MNLVEQLAQSLQKKCIHFNGIMEKCCRAGVNYDAFRGNGPIQLPCLKQGGECQLATFRTDAEAKEEAEAWEALSTNSMIVLALIKQERGRDGKVNCPCGGIVRYIKAPQNGHIRAKCNKCGLFIQE